VSKPTEAMPAELQCVQCNGMDDHCKSCDGTGTFPLTDCPWQFIDKATIEATKYVSAAEHHLPLSGGMLDQTQSFVDCLDWLTNEKNKWENDRNT
jgi:hypothetical protein